MPAKSTIQIKFVVTKAGDFPYYCSVSCGSGVVDGEERGHFDQIGRLHVRSIISETVDYTAPTTEELKAQARIAAIKKEADRKAVELGYDTNILSITIDDEEKSVWKTHVVEMPTQEHEASLQEFGINEFYVVFYANEQDEVVLWVFVDAVTGDIVSHEEN